MRQKKWGIVFICLLIGLLSLTSVTADTIKDIPFTVKGNAKLSEVDIFPFYIGNDKISMQLMPYSYVEVYINGKLIEVPSVTHKVICPRKDYPNYYPDCYDREWQSPGNRVGESGFYTIDLGKALTKSDIVTLIFADDGNIQFGQLVFETEAGTNDRLQKEREHEELQYAEQLFKQSIIDENNKAWYDNVSDFFQDTWWNVTGWWYQ